MADRVVLAYSGGLDTSVAISWIGKETGAEVVAVAIDLGQGGEDMEVVRQRAIDCGAVESVVVDARDEFADEYCLPTIAANALYMDRYPLVSAISRPLIVKHIVEAARSHGGTIVSHGCTGKGNDQVRFEVGFGALAPDLQVIAPVRDYAWTARRPSPSPKRTTSRSTSPRSRRSRSTRTSGAAPSKPVSSRICGTRRRRTSTTTPRTRQSTGTHPTSSSSASTRVARLPSTAARCRFSKPSRN
ncbi:hypothetical protein GCM10020255_084310 [Rhodococcus baikonurensis]